MATCTEVATFLGQAAQRNVSATLAPADAAALAQLGLITLLSAADYQALQQEVAQLQQQQAALAAEGAQRAQAAGSIAADSRRSHSILFRLEGVDHRTATLERLQQEQAALKSIDADLAQRQQAFAQLLVRRSVLDTACPYAGGYVAVTTPGRMALRDLNVRLYRVGGEEFAGYWAGAQAEDASLGGLAATSALVEGRLATVLPTVDHSYLWAVAIGMAKAGGDADQRLQAFYTAYQGLAPAAVNVENRLMASEILTALKRTAEQSVPFALALDREVKKVGVPDASALGVAAILLLGERADGTYALPELARSLTLTRSYESAALLAIVNRPDVAEKFQAVRALFAGWGYSPSEDTELSSAYLAISELPVDSVSPKLAILARGLQGYLEYPLVASSILASIPVLEANETLNLLEKAYEILGQRSGPMSQAELICLAVRLVHSVRSVNELDATARAQPPSFTYLGRPPIFWGPVVILHGSYYSTFSGLGGAHPGHVHGWGGGGFGGGFVG
jgi:hypothetical protein